MGCTGPTVGTENWFYGLGDRNFSEPPPTHTLLGEETLDQYLAKAASR